MKITDETVIYDGAADNFNTAIVLCLGDVLVLHKRDVTRESFSTSGVGKLFDSSAVDEVRLESKLKPWGEVYFELTFKAEGLPVTEDDFYFYTDGLERCGEDSIYTEPCGYPMLRYLTMSGNATTIKTK